MRAPLKVMVAVESPDGRSVPDMPLVLAIVGDALGRAYTVTHGPVATQPGRRAVTLTIDAKGVAYVA